MYGKDDATMNYVLDSSKAHHKYFEELCYIPHPPFQEKALSEYVIAFAKERIIQTPFIMLW